jgi:predicted MFS family arabinose efflux permease
MELASRVVAVRHRNRALGLISGGAAVGICVNGLLISPLFSSWVWQELWVLSAVITLFLGALLWGLFLLNTGLADPGAVAVAGGGQPAESVSVLDALKLCFRHRVARQSCLLSAMIGIMAAPYMTYLNVYLTEELGYASMLASMTWNLAGLGGLFAGVGLGWMADRLGGPIAIRFSLLLFLIGVIILAFAPRPWLVPIAGVTYGVMYFPFFGLIAGKFSRFFEPRIALHLVSLSLVAFSIFAAIGNWAGGHLYQQTGSLTLLYSAIAGIALVTLLLSLALPKAEPNEGRCRSGLCSVS